MDDSQFTTEAKKTKEFYRTKWKTIAIIILILFLIENLIIFYGYYKIIQDEKKEMKCWYDICSEFADAEYDYDLNVCYCYDYDMLGYLVINKTEYMG